MSVGAHCADDLNEEKSVFLNKITAVSTCVNSYLTVNITPRDDVARLNTEANYLLLSTIAKRCIERAAFSQGFETAINVLF